MNRRIMAFLMVVLGATSLHAQTPGPIRLPGGIVLGRVVDAETGLGLGSSTVVLEPLNGGAFPVGSRFIPATRTARTDSAGVYNFGGVPPGDYRLHIQQPAYRSTTVNIRLHGTSNSRSVGFSVEPIALERLKVSAVLRPELQTQTCARAATLREQGDQRVLTECERQRRGPVDQRRPIAEQIRELGSGAVELALDGARSSMLRCSASNSAGTYSQVL